MPLWRGTFVPETPLLDSQPQIRTKGTLLTCSTAPLVFRRCMPGRCSEFFGRTSSPRTPCMFLTEDACYAVRQAMHHGARIDRKLADPGLQWHGRKWSRQQGATHYALVPAAHRPQRRSTMPSSGPSGWPQHRALRWQHAGATGADASSFPSGASITRSRPVAIRLGSQFPGLHHGAHPVSPPSSSATPARRWTTRCLLRALRGGPGGDRSGPLLRQGKWAKWWPRWVGNRSTSSLTRPFTTPGRTS